MHDRDTDHLCRVCGARLRLSASRLIATSAAASVLFVFAIYGMLALAFDLVRWL